MADDPLLGRPLTSGLGFDACTGLHLVVAKAIAPAAWDVNARYSAGGRHEAQDYALMSADRAIKGLTAAGYRILSDSQYDDAISDAREAERYDCLG